MSGIAATPRWLRFGLGALLFVFAFAALPGCRGTDPSAVPGSVDIELVPDQLAADGRGVVRLRVQGAGQPDVETEGNLLHLVSRRPQDGGEEITFRAGVLPGETAIFVRAGDRLLGRRTVTLLPVYSDRWRDGTPDFLRLDTPQDREAFRTWFTFLSEAQAFRDTQDLPVEVNDCAALLRFAYRESFTEHTGEWAAKWKLPMIPEAGEVAKYRYPFTPLRAHLFRVAGEGPFSPSDLEAGSFAQFADARTIWSRNTHRVSRELSRARPGDLLFYHQLGQNLPFHAMIFLGPSQFEPGPERWLIYHTGPVDGGPGEIRRRELQELLQHPEPQWRPVAGNPNFLGVYRWNILRETD